MRRTIATVVGIVWVCAGTATAAPRYGPQGVVRQFCRTDAAAARMAEFTWADAVAPLVEWAFEPAWDHVVVVSGYEVGEPTITGENELTIAVRYSITGRISAEGFEPEPHLQTLRYRVHPGDGGSWRIAGPPPPPHVFESRAEVAAVRRSLDPANGTLLTNSTFVWQMFRSAGWSVAFERTLDMPNGATYGVVETPKIGDVVLISAGESPYHVGIVAREGEMISATVNAGVVSTPIGWFVGKVTYMRLLEPPPAADDDPAWLRKVPSTPRRENTPGDRPRPNSPTPRQRTTPKSPATPTPRPRAARAPAARPPVKTTPAGKPGPPKTPRVPR